MIYGITDTTKFETGGVYYSVSVDGRKFYTFTDSVINTSGNPHSVQPLAALGDVPKDATVEGYYHNHVNSSNFSNQDFIWANSQNTFLTGGMPNSTLRIVDQNGNDTQIASGLSFVQI